MKTVDIDEIERKARSISNAQTRIPGCLEPDECCCCAPVTLALIARIRELSALSHRALWGWQIHHECVTEFSEAEAREIEGGRALLARGVVLP